MSVVNNSLIILLAHSHLILVDFGPEVTIEYHVAVIRQLVTIENLVPISGTQPMQGYAIDDADALSLFVANGNACLIRCLEMEVSCLDLIQGMNMPRRAGINRFYILHS